MRASTRGRVFLSPTSPEQTPAREFLLKFTETIPALEYAAPPQQERLRPLIFWLLITDLLAICAAAFIILIHQ